MKHKVLPKEVKTFRLSKAVLGKVGEMAAEENRTVNNMVETILKDYVKAYAPTNTSTHMVGA